MPGRFVKVGCLVSLAGAVAVTACAPATRLGGAAGDSAAPTRESTGEPGRKKVLNLALSALIDAFSIAASSVTAGGKLSYNEIHSQALFTADKRTGRPIPRLLADHPTLDNGGLRLTADGRLVATYKLRPDVKWADGVPLTTRPCCLPTGSARTGRCPSSTLGRPV